VRRISIAVTIAMTLLAATSVAVPTSAGAATVAVEEWAVGFCNALDRWQTGATKVRDVVKGVVDDGVRSSARARTLRTRIVNGFDDARKSAVAASDAIEDLGDPDVAGGATVRTTLASAIDQTATAFAVAKTAASDTSTDPKKFQSAMKTIYRQVDKGLERAGGRIEQVGTLTSGGELDTAISNEQACDFLSGT
jgi:hypothetical protein